MNIVSLFSGCGGLDTGFTKAGFKVIWANEYDRTIWETYEKNHKDTFLEKRSITKILSSEIPNTLGIIGGPPCQSWSAGGKKLGFKDPRGQLFLEFIRVINDKNPLFFIAENVTGMLASRHKDSLESIVEKFENAGTYGYEITYAPVDATWYGVPQHRKRLFFIGYRKDLNIKFEFPKKDLEINTVQDAIGDIEVTPLPANWTKINKDCVIPNHEYSTQGYSYIFMSRNRVLSWKKSAFTIQASARHIPLHPSAPPMIKVEKDVMIFDKNKESLYRRLSVRECARIQTFPDNFIFYYSNIENGYKMIGNAVPVELGYRIAKKINEDLLTAIIKKAVARHRLIHLKYNTANEMKSLEFTFESNNMILENENSLVLNPEVKN